MKKSLKQRTVLLVIRVNRRLFYNTPIHRNKYVNVAYQKIFRSAYAPGQELIVEYAGNKYHFPSDDITILPSLLNDSYEKAQISIFKSKIKPGMTVVDIGANIGLYSVIASKATGSKGHVYSFEPEPSNYKLLCKNISLNQCTNVSPQKMAVGSKSGSADLFKESGSIGTHSLIKKPTADPQNKISVKVTSLDEYFKANKKVDVIKLDVEGHELAVLLGGTRVLKNVKYLFFEYNPLAEESENLQFEKALKHFKHFYLIDEKTSRTTATTLQKIKKLKYANILAAND